MFMVWGECLRTRVHANEPLGEGGEVIMNPKL